MQKLVNFVIAASTVISAAAFAQENIKAPAPTSAYLQDSRGVIARSGTGLCWRDGYWTPADATVEGCDGVVAKPPVVVAPRAPAPVIVPPAPAPAPAPAPVPPAPVVEKVTFAADAVFDFDKAVLKNEGKEKLDDLAVKLKGLNLEAIIAVGHTDNVGSDAYNQKLSLHRAEAVKAYLVSKGVEPSRIFTEGKGEKQPVAENKTADGRAKNRRVDIEVVGSRTK